MTQLRVPRINEEVCGASTLAPDAIALSAFGGRDARRLSAGGYAKILVVDDYSDTAESTATWLKQLGHEVEIALDGIEAIEVARGQQPEYVLLDLCLPRLDGYEVAVRLRQELAGPLVIIAITGYAQETCRRRALEAGCDHYLLKPVDPDALISLLPHPVPDSAVQNGPPPAAMQCPMPVARREIEIVNTLGLHLRAANKFVRLAREFQASVAVTHDGREVNGKSILDLATLAVESGSRVAVNAEGSDALAAVDALTALILQGERTGTATPAGSRGPNDVRSHNPFIHKSSQYTRSDVSRQISLSQCRVFEFGRSGGNRQVEYERMVRESGTKTELNHE